jgi:SAM-dependent methyltransferase
MLGQHTALLETAPRRWVQTVWGYPEIHTRQKWSALWPYLDTLPHEGIRLLDAGCGTGRWSLELAARRPRWSVVGLDLDQKALQEAESAKHRLGLHNVSFVHCDFRNFESTAGFDVVLSVSSVHYLVAAGEAAQLFDQFSRWLAPGGRLMILAPRRAEAALFMPGLPRPEYQGLSSADELAALCGRAGFQVEQLVGAIGKLGVLAKQLNLATTGWRRSWTIAVYPFQWLISSLDRRNQSAGERLMLMWVLIARLRSDVDSRSSVE